jgi:CO/xanthine dehydrogenase FAD-binding subunit
MRQFDYISPTNIADVCKLLDEFKEDAQLLAGGTDLLIGLRKPSTRSLNVMIDISRVSELMGIEEIGDSVRIKPLATHADIYQSTIIQQYAPLLRQAVATIGSPQIRNRGTVGGNIMNAAACADTVPPLMALDAMVTVQSVHGERMVPLRDFFVKPYQTVAEKNEVLTEIIIPKLLNSTKSVFIKLGRRNALAISRLSVAAILRQSEQGVIQDARIVPGAAFPQWQRVTDAEKILIGHNPSRELFTEAGKKVSEVMISFTGRRWSTEYKEPVISVLVRRALEACQ